VPSSVREGNVPLSGLDNQAAVVVEHLSKSYRGGGRAPLVPVPVLFRRGRSDVQVSEKARDDDVEPDDGLEEEFEEPTDDAASKLPGRGGVWALRDVSFEVAQGTALGIIGPNGSGKSTLLKILARVTPPTEGHAAVRGRVVPMIDVAASFLQPDLHARENVALLARLFGVPPDFATGRLREILDFADLTDFERARTKTYSSGLLRRLAFSTVLHFEPDVLLADEVISVGDAAFRERCLASIAQRRERGLTLLFATHDLDMLRRTCDQALWLDTGRVRLLGPIQGVVDQYETTAKVRKPGATLQPKARGATGGKGRSFTQDAAVLSGGLYSLDGVRIESLSADEDAEVRMEIDVATPGAELRFGAALTAGKRDGVRLVQSSWTQVRDEGRYVVSTKLPRGLLGNGHYVGRVGGFVRVGGEEAAIALLDAFDIEAFRPAPLENDEEKRPDGIQELQDVTWRVQVAPSRRQPRGAPRESKKPRD
jgi:ABC-type polysaccharide/polyol phosphate transport system ATPase subunit